MRAVERTPWAERRSTRHDEICSAIATDPDALMHFMPGGGAKVERGTVEAKCGPGFCDVLLETHGREVAWFVEVKTDAERASAGDVIRQLKWYASQRQGFVFKWLVCVTETQPDAIFQRLLRQAGVRLVTFEEIWDISRANQNACDAPAPQVEAPAMEPF